MDGLPATLFKGRQLTVLLLYQLFVAGIILKNTILPQFQIKPFGKVDLKMLRANLLTIHNQSGS